MLKRIVFWGFLSQALVLSVMGEDRNRMNVSLTTGGNPIKARAFIMDPQGRRFGQDPQTGIFHREVPNYGYDLSSIAADDGSGEATPEGEDFYIEPVISGNYRISVYALESSTYALVVNSINFSGVRQPPMEVTGSLMVGGVSAHTLTVNPTPGAPPPTLVKVGADDDPVLPILACVERKDEKGHWGHRQGRHKFRGHRRRHPFHVRKHRKDKDLIAVFGYENKNAGAVDVPVGPDNKFSPLPEDRGQTESFEPGVVEEAFEVPFDKKGSLTWTLRGPDGQVRSVTADKRSPGCE